MERRAIQGSATVVAVALLVAGCAAALLMVAQKAEATFPGKNGRIAYVDYFGVLYTINPDGSAKTKVTDHLATGYSLDYSPDGKKITYTDYDSGPDSEIYTIDVGGGGKTNVTNNNRYDS
jgi:Tol biopolymer transport system component